MPRPKTKDELLVAGNEKFTKLNTLIDSYPPQQQKADFPPGTLNRNIRDVLAHLHHWHIMMLKWHEVGMRGEKPAMPTEKYSWKDTPQLNDDINKMYATLSLKKARSLLDESHTKVMNLIMAHSDAELFTKKYYKWTGSTSLGAYLVSSTSSHYDWAFKLIKRSLKA